MMIKCKKCEKDRAARIENAVSNRFKLIRCCSCGFKRVVNSNEVFKANTEEVENENVQ